MNKLINLMLMILLLLMPVVSHASYANGFFGMIILYFVFPMPIIGLVLSLILAKKKLFNDDSFFSKYILVWVVLSFAIFIFSLTIFGGDDPLSFLIIFLGLFVYNFIIFIPVIIQRIKNKNSNQ